MVSKASSGARSPAISAVDVFCGVGGLTFGLTRGGIEVAWGIDIDEKCRFPYTENNNAGFLNKDVRGLDADYVNRIFKPGALRLLAGCAPCQPFSTYSRQRRIARGDDKWDLLLDFGKLAQELKPDFVTMENVPQLADHPVFHEFMKQLKGYHISFNVVECSKYGIPQTRKRLVLLASRWGSISLLPPTHARHPKTVRHAIAGLPPIAAGEQSSRDPIHAACSLSSINLRRIKVSKPGGTWRDWPKILRSDCHKRVSGETYPSVYGRMEWDAPAPTITTQCFGFGNGRFGHPEQDRAISLREAAILQTFPRSYKFVPPGTAVRFSTLGRLIGNAVPVRLGEIVAKSIYLHLAQMRAQGENL